jgi:hypothetical protein
MRTTSLTSFGVGLAVLAGGTLLALPQSAAQAASTGPPLAEVPLYTVTQEGLTVDDARRLADQAKIGPALRPDGSFAYASSSYARVPSRPAPSATRLGKDENGRQTTARVLDRKALAATTVISDAAALDRAKGLLGAVPGALTATPRVDHTTVEVSDAKGSVTSRTAIDTTVTYGFSLAGVPVVGPGAKQRVSFSPNGSIAALTRSLRTVQAEGSVAVITPDEASKKCTAAYGPGVGQGEPTLAYYAPPLAADRANGAGRVTYLTPHYVCDPSDAPSDAEVPLTGRMIPAAPVLTPSATLKARGDGSAVTAGLEVGGGTAPYTVTWSSSSANLRSRSGAEVSYRVGLRRKATSETLTATVSDANGVSVAASVTLAGASGEAGARSTGGVGGAFASIGIEQTVDEWQCAQDSANGFRDVMSARGHTTSFDWRGANAWERDFRKTSAGGNDVSYVDAVDAQWYTGHGSSGGFTFKSSVDDTVITPGDARWGDNDNLEWMQLESCQVLRDTNGAADYFSRWAPAFDGLHLLNGFDTNAYCVTGGTGRRFAEYLFPETFLWWTVRPAQTVSQAWSRMADDLEPAGVRWRSISPIGGGWVHNLDDHLWGQGTVGPDIPASTRIGFIAISGVS